MEKVRIYESRVDMDLSAAGVQRGFDTVIDGITGLENRMDRLESKMDKVLDILRNGNEKSSKMKFPDSKTTYCVM